MQKLKEYSDDEDEDYEFERTNVIGVDSDNVEFISNLRKELDAIEAEINLEDAFSFFTKLRNIPARRRKRN